LKILPYNDDGEICVKNIVYKEVFQKYDLILAILLFNLLNFVVFF